MNKHQFWLFKSEPAEFSIFDLERSPGQTTVWSGIRNYMARNLLRDHVKLGDQLFFYHSSTDAKGVAGICRVSRSAYPDPSALDPQTPYFDPKSSASNPIWVAVDVTLVHRFPVLVPLATLKVTASLKNMQVCKQGNRLSIQPVTAVEWKNVLKLADRIASG